MIDENVTGSDISQNANIPAHGAPRRLAIVLALTAVFTIVEIAGGLLSNSLTLLADAGHMSTDVLALGLAWMGARIAQRREGAPRHFGNLRWEVLAALLNGLLLFVIAAAICIEAIDRYSNPRPIDTGMLGGIATVGLLVNVVALRVLHGSHEHDLNARGAYLHILADVLGSIGAIVGAVVIHYTGWLWVDPTISVLVSILILQSAARLVRRSAWVLLDRVPGHLQETDVERALSAVPGVSRVHDLHVWTVAGGLIAMSAHVVVPGLDQHPTALRRLEHAMADLGIQHVTLQLETGEECVGELCGDADGSVAGSVLAHPHSH